LYASTLSFVDYILYVCGNKTVNEIREYYRGKYHCTVDLLFDWFGIVCFAKKTKIVSCHTGESKPVKQELNGTVIFPPLVFPEENHTKNYT
jgi:hypothetical protein